MSKSEIYPKESLNLEKPNRKSNFDKDLIYGLKSLANKIKERGSKLEEFCLIIQQQKDNWRM